MTSESTTGSRMSAPARAGDPPRVPAPGVPVHLRRRQPDGDQRVRAAGGPMFLNRGMIETAQDRRRGCGRDGPRALARRAASRHRTGDQRRRSSRSAPSLGQIPGAVVGGTAGSIISQGIAVRPWHSISEVQPRIRVAGRHPRRADYRARRVRPAPRWPTCSRRSRPRAAAAAPSG